MTLTFNRDGEVPDVVPAATVILIRDGEDGLETLVLRRNSKLAFAGGHWVFPGGRVDDGDVADGETDRLSLAAARRAAVREAAEEAGLVVATDALVPFSHWTPPAVAIKRFSTWFFLAPAPTGDVTIDGGEIHEHLWARPGDALHMRDEGEIELSPPTWRTLDRLAQSATVAEAMDDAVNGVVEHFVTRIALAEGGAVAMWHGDAGYEAEDPELPGPRHRLWMVPGPWRYERDTEPTDPTDPTATTASTDAAATADATDSTESTTED